MRKTQTAKWMTVAGAVLVAGTVAQAAGVKVSPKEGQYVKLGGRIQLQYHVTDPAAGDSSDQLIFRRLRPYIEGSVHPDWKGKFQWDMGKGGVEIKDAYFLYTGIDGLDIGLGNMNFPFSRELLTSSKYQQLVERTFVGDHNYGTPDRQAGLHLSGGFMDDVVTWAVSAVKAAQDPDNKKLDIETTISLESGDDWSEGEIVGGRNDLHPFGPVKFSQGDFSREFGAVIGAAAFVYRGDEDNLDPERSKKDVDSVTGFEISGGLRGWGLSVDAQYNQFNSELVEAGITSGLYVDSETTLKNWAVEGGYMVVPGRLELVGGYQSQDADGYADTWNRTSVGLNWFVKKHDVKYQLTYQMGENVDGKTGNDVDELFVQAQYVF